MLVTNTAPASDGGWDANSNLTEGAAAYYQIDNFRITASEIPEPSTILLSMIAAGGLMMVRRRP